MRLPRGKTGNGNLPKSLKYCGSDQRDGCATKCPKQRIRFGHNFVRREGRARVSRLRQELHLGDQFQVPAKLLTCLFYGSWAESESSPIVLSTDRIPIYGRGGDVGQEMRLPGSPILDPAFQRSCAAALIDAALRPVFPLERRWPATNSSLYVADGIERRGEGRL
jgi:hypothetical protein